jgi:SAM-dependent methyltransferase
VVGFYKDDGEGTMETSYGDEKGNEATLIRHDVEEAPLPLKDNSADVVVMMEVFEHFGIDPMHALWDVNRVLKPGGRFLFSTPNAACWRHAVRAIRGKAPIQGLEYSGYSTNRHNRLYDMDELQGILTAAGFEVTRSYGRTYGDEPTDRSGRLLHGALSLFDRLTQFRTGQRPVRDHFLVLEAVKKTAPGERYPAGLYFSPDDWPGIIEQRELRLRKLNRNA